MKNHPITDNIYKKAAVQKERKVKCMSEKQKEIIRDLAKKLPEMNEHQRGYLEGTIATAAAMSKKGERKNEESNSGVY